MKFSHALKFNANSAWKDHYINYNRLKKLIYRKEAEETKGLSLNFPDVANRTSIDLERQDMLERQVSMALEGGHGVEDDLEKAFDSELLRIVQFYQKKEAELLEGAEELERLERQVRSSPGRASQTLTAPAGRRSSGAHDDPEQPLLDTGNEAEELAEQSRFWAQNAVNVRIAREKLRDKLQEQFVDLQALVDFVEVNRTGFRKALKKHDKVLGPLGHPKLLATYFPKVEASFPEKHRLRVQDAIDRLVRLYGNVCCQGSIELAELELKSELRSQLKLERTTVWKDMVERERKGHSATVEDFAPGLTSWLQRNRQYFMILLAAIAFAVLLAVPIFEDAPKQNCLALLAAVSILWCTEALPLYVTSMLVPLLAVVLRVMMDDSGKTPQRKSAPDAADAILKSMFSQTIMLLLGGFAIASAFTKHFIAKRMATWVLSKVSSKPQYVLLANMLVATFASMWITNVAAPVLCFSLLQPILRTLPSGHSFAKSLVLGIALASNLGGMTSPISSPQNIFAIQEMGRGGNSVSWLSWFAVALPIAFVGNLICWGALLTVYRPNKTLKEVRRLPDTTDPITWKQAYVIFIALGTVALWCANSALDKYVGQMGIVAIIPMVFFFGFGLLNKDDFNNQLWNVVMLAMGGSALGEAVKSSGLLSAIAHGIQDLIIDYGTWEVLAIFCALVLVATTFISHTVGAMVILPIVQAVGADMSDPHPKLLVMGAALMCSGAMGLPVSGFPNMNAIALEDQTGKPYLTTLDFLRVGVPCSVATYFLVVSVGYVIMRFFIGW
ncbi:g5137 [Coccomyxa viridis]|uniref:G5137 protein n=1 Tax=Coccomyxa viridis TaxID=1274662 RepID=A0ABP1FS23_9CHLO